MIRVLTAVALLALWAFLAWWGYGHAIALHVERERQMRHAVTYARDMQRMQDTTRLRGCQTRVMMDELHMGTDIMIAKSALKQAGMER